MAKSKQPANPFYVLVVLVGIAFAITACAYGTMAYRAVARSTSVASDSAGLMALVDRYGMQTLAVELALLGVAACGAMGLDRWRSRREERDRDPAR